MLFGALACNRPNDKLRTGDLLFQAGQESAMSGAIAAATGDGDVLAFTHVGIAICCKGADSVLEATSEGGVRMTALNEFLSKSAQVKGRPAVAVKRLKDTTGVAAAVVRARSYMGWPYDYSYLPDNGKIYCSELVQEGYLAPDGRPIFPARPMNFRAPDGAMPAFWVELFERLGEAIPEGVPGTNPNDMAQDSALVEVFRWF